MKKPFQHPSRFTVIFYAILFQTAPVFGGIHVLSRAARRVPHSRIQTLVHSIPLSTMRPPSMPVGFSKELPHRGAMKFLFPLAVLSSTMLEYRNWAAELEVQESQRAYEIAVSKIQSALSHVFAMSNPQKLGSIRIKIR